MRIRKWSLADSLTALTIAATFLALSVWVLSLQVWRLRARLNVLEQMTIDASRG